MQFLTPVTLPLVLLLPPTALLAGEHSGGHAPHEHGAARLDIVAEHNHLSLALQLSAMDVVGFEHAPRDAAQTEQIARAKAQLGDAGALFAPTPDAGCTIQSAKVTQVVLGGHEDPDEHHGKHERHEDHDEDHEEHEHHEDHDEAHEEHEHHEDHDDHHEKHEKEPDDHEKHEAHDDQSEPRHSEFRARYVFQCAKPKVLKTVDTQLFSLFPKVAELRVQAVTEHGQDAARLRPPSQQIPLP